MAPLASASKHVKFIRLAAYSAEALCKAEAIEKALRVSQCSTKEIIETEDDIMNEEMSDASDSVFGGETPRATISQCQTKTPTPVQNTPYTTSTSHTKSQNPEISRCSAALMSDIKGLLDLTSQYLQDLENKHPGVGSDFLALLTDGASRAMIGQRIYMAQPNQEITKIENTASWADVTATNISNHKASFFKRQRLLALAPQGQSKEDRKIMIRIGTDHEARKTGAYELKEKIKRLVSDSSPVPDVWKVPLGFAILAPTPAKAATISQAKTAIEENFGNAVVERQKIWTTFVIGPVPKTIQCIDGTREPMDGHLHEELVAVCEAVPIKYMNWRRSNNDEPCGHIRIYIPESKPGKPPSRLRFFGEAVSVQRIRKSNKFSVCTKFHGFHATRICVQSNKCHICGTDEHTGP
ncbi:hypothetical protein EPUL_004258, partial [Erysiphe pulchra]